MNIPMLNLQKLLSNKRKVFLIGAIFLLALFTILFLLKARLDNPYYGDKVVNLTIIDSKQKQYKLGDTFEVALFLDRDVKQNTIEGVINFDPYTLEMLSINNLTDIDENLVIGKMIDNKEGIASFDMASTKEFFSLNKQLITFTFKVINTINPEVNPNAQIKVTEQTTMGYPNILKKEDLDEIIVQFLNE